MENCYINPSNKWSQLAYAGESLAPFGEEPSAYSWPLCFLRRNEQGLFTDRNGNIAHLEIKDPDMTFNIGKEFEEIRVIQENLTEEQKYIAKYWGDGPATKQFMPIAEILIDTYGVNVCTASRILYVLSGALNDACAVSWYYKYKYDVLRPNQYCTCFKTLLCTPRHPSYPAGHSTMAGAMCGILSYFFPGESGVLEELAEQCSDSRLYAGVHYRSDCVEGVRLGKSVANVIIQELKEQTNDKGVLIDRPYLEDKEANIKPDIKKQYIPYDRKGSCTSLIL